MNPDKCACLKNDLAPCDNMNCQCEAGYLQEKQGAEHNEYDFVIGLNKPIVVDVDKLGGRQ